jgi:protein-S-isoprenylcysteine O-methyltransferase Ste14
MNPFFGYFQITALALLVALVAGRAVYLRWAHGIQAFTVARGKRGLAWLVELAFLPFLLAWMTEVVLHATNARFRLFPWPLDLRLVDSDVFGVVGAVLITLALALLILALVAFGRSWRVGIDEERPGGLVRGGIFAVSRNPIFVALDLYFLGTFLINGTLAFLLFAVVMALGVHYQILQEERFLRQHYGQGYEAYCRTTGRYFGWRRPAGGSPGR